MCTITVRCRRLSTRRICRHCRRLVQQMQIQSGCTARCAVRFGETMPSPGQSANAMRRHCVSIESARVRISYATAASRRRFLTLIRTAQVGNGPP